MEKNKAEASNCALSFLHPARTRMLQQANAANTMGLVSHPLGICVLAV